MGACREGGEGGRGEGTESLPTELASGPGYCLRTRGGGGGCLRPWPAPADPPTHIRKLVLGQKIKFIKGGGNLRPIFGAQTFFWPLTPARGSP